MTIDDYNYIKSENLGASELMKKAIIMHKNGEISLDKFYTEEIERLRGNIRKLQNAITSVGESKWL